MEVSIGNRGLLVKIVTLWLCIFLLIGFILTARSVASPLSLSVIPQVPRVGEPILVSFAVSNPDTKAVDAKYELYANGRLKQAGMLRIAPGESAKYQYVCASTTLQRGEQASFVLNASSPAGSFSRAVSLPAYPPQLMSSFVSFAAFSTSVMSSMISAEYFKNTFGTARGVNAGVMVTAVLIALLIFLELTQAVRGRGRFALLTAYRVSFSTLSAILFIIMLGMVFTTTVLIISGSG